MEPYVVFLSGASGAGKSTLIKKLAEKYTNSPNLTFLHFDSIGVPSPEEMTRLYGSGKAWQKATTYEWIKTIATNYKDKDIVFIEGQTELTFIKDAFKQNNIDNYQILLVHTQFEERHKRLVEYRNQSELVNEEMDNWAKYLLNQAHELGCEIINNNESIESSLAFVENFLNTHK